MPDPKFELAVLRPALVTALTPVAAAAVSGGMQLSAYMLGSPTFPTIEVAGPEEITYDIAGSRGGDQVNILIRAFVGLTTDEGAQKVLDQLLNSDGPLSIKQAIEADPKLGGACDDLRVTKCTGYQVYSAGNPAGGRDFVVGAEWTVQIETNG